MELKPEDEAETVEILRDEFWLAELEPAMVVEITESLSKVFELFSLAKSS